MFGIAALFYLFFLLIFIGGIFVVTYHLLTFRLNKSLAWFMTSFLIAGAIILVSINIFYFSRIDWQTLFAGSNLL
jgi:hypothetical protein